VISKNHWIYDNPNLVEPIKQMGSKTLLLFDQPWNKDSICTLNVIRISSWEQIIKVLKKLKKDD
jgi:hypothetical protein